MVTLRDQRISMVACGYTFTVAVSEGRLHTLTVNRLVWWSLQDQRITMVACGDTFTMAVSEGR